MDTTRNTTGNTRPNARRRRVRKVQARGSLTVVGTGYLMGAHLTAEARTSIERAEKVFYAVGDVPTESWIRTLNSTAESLRSLYGEGKDRLLTYEEMIERILSAVRQGLDVCAAFYGHPGVCAYPT